MVYSIQIARETANKQKKSFLIKSVNKFCLFVQTSVNDND